MSEHVQVDLKAEEQEALRERTAAWVEWECAGDAIEAVEHFGVLPDESDHRPRGERTMRAARTGAPKGRTIDDRVEREIVLETLRKRRLDAGKRMLAAKGRVAQAKVALANEKLPGLVASHAQAAEELLAARHSTEQAMLDYIAFGIVLREAEEREKAAAVRVTRTALDAAPDNETRQAIRDCASSDAVPIALAGDGTIADSRDRPLANLFGLGADCWNVGNDGCGTNVSGTIARGRSKLGDSSDRVEQRFIEPIRRRLRNLDKQRSNHS